MEEVIVKQESLEENVGYIGEDLTDIQDELFEEVTFEDLMDIEDEYVEVKCKCCGKPLFVEKDALNKNNNIPCPFVIIRLIKKKLQINAVSFFVLK